LDMVSSEMDCYKIGFYAAGLAGRAGRESGFFLT